MRRQTPLRPSQRPQHGVGHNVTRCGQCHHVIHLHRHVGPDPLLNSHRRLRRKLDRAAVEMGAEARPSLGHADLLREGEDLEAAAVGECGPLPAHERCHTAGLLDNRLARTQMKVVGVGKHHAGTGLGNPANIDPLHAGKRRHRHEQRRRHAPMRRRKHARPRPTRAHRVELKRKSRPHAQKPTLLDRNRASYELDCRLR